MTVYQLRRIVQAALGEE